MDREHVRTLDAAADTFLEAATLVLTDAALDRLNADDPDPVGRLVDGVVERLREELTQAVQIGISGA